MSDFRPRWYYIVINKTSGKKYIGQTVRENMDEYCGSGRYWTKHCKKHGGWNRSNVQVLEQTWLTKKDEAEKWLQAFAAKNNGYWSKENTEWANNCKETTEDCAFAGLTADQRKTYCAIGGKITGRKCAESGHMTKMAKLGAKAGAHLGGKSAGKKAVESGRWKKCQAEGLKTRSKNLQLMSQFCKVFSITSPGTGYGKIDKVAFHKWKLSLPDVV
jgi:hypothetical protein